MANNCEVGVPESIVKFKSVKRKQLRTRRESSSEEEEDTKSEPEENVISKLQETKEVQKLRRRPHGVSIVGLALGKKITSEEEASVKDPFKTKTGGMIDMKALKSGKVKQNDDAYETGIGTQFSAETNTRDEDEEMMKYIEDELAKKTGKKKTIAIEVTKPETTKKFSTPDEAALLAVPEHLRKSSGQKSEEMLSNQMLSGIPEVDLGIEAKIKNIEKTEEAKYKLLLERRKQKDSPSQFVPTNMAVNFVQHNRFSLEDSEPPRKRERHHIPKETRVVVVGGEPVEAKLEKSKPPGEKATDDYHYERFKKQFRSY